MLLVATGILMSFTKTSYKANFSGSWSLNEGKSELGEMGRFVARKIKAEQKDDAITISKSSTTPNGDEVTNTETLTFDGKASETTVFGSSKKKSTASWSGDGNTLTIDYTIAFERNGQTTNITGTETWTLVDGKLSVHVVSTSPMGERSYTAVYDK